LTSKAQANRRWAPAVDQNAIGACEGDAVSLRASIGDRFRVRRRRARREAIDRGYGSGVERPPHGLGRMAAKISRMACVRECRPGNLFNVGRTTARPLAVRDDPSEAPSLGSSHHARPARTSWRWDT
jgi:hypothetical protein